MPIDRSRGGEDSLPMDRLRGRRLVCLGTAYAAGATFEKVDETIDWCGADSKLTRSKPAHSTPALVILEGADRGSPKRVCELWGFAMATEGSCAEYRLYVNFRQFVNELSVLKTQHRPYVQVRRSALYLQDYENQIKDLFF